MEHRQLGRSGLRVSLLSFGAMTLGESQGFVKGVTSSGAEARRVLDRALDAVEQVARRIGATPSAVSLTWLLARPELSSVIVGARTVAQLEENLQALTVKLSPEDVAELDRASVPDWGYPQSFIGAREPW